MGFLRRGSFEISYRAKNIPMSSKKKKWVDRAALLKRGYLRKRPLPCNLSLPSRVTENGKKNGPKNTWLLFAQITTPPPYGLRLVFNWRDLSKGSKGTHTITADLSARLGLIIYLQTTDIKDRICGLKWATKKNTKIDLYGNLFC